MGSIAELLGYSLDPDSLDGAAGDQAPAPGALDEKADAGEERRATAMAAVLAETGLEPAAARAELSLRSDLDLDDLVLYAIVARIEHELRIRIPDAEVESWRTLSDLLEAVAERN